MGQRCARPEPGATDADDIEAKGRGSISKKKRGKKDKSIDSMPTGTTEVDELAQDQE